jgi:Mitochondrial K+-H+ exchange-related
MRILLLPLTRRQTLLFAQRLAENEANNPSPLAAWITNKVQKTWADWGKSETRWKSKTVSVGNKLLDKIDWEEYALKTVNVPKTVTTEKVIASNQGIFLAD